MREDWHESIHLAEGSLKKLIIRKESDIDCLGRELLKKAHVFTNSIHACKRLLASWASDEQQIYIVVSIAPKEGPEPIDT